MKLGDVVERGAKIVGVKPCEGCKRRKEVLNTISRRGVIWGGVTALLLAKNAIMQAAWKVAGVEAPVDLPTALGLVRTANTVQSNAFLSSGTHLSKEDMLLGVASHKEHFPPNSPGYGWMSRLRPASNEPIPGWSLDFVWDQKSYRFILRGAQYTIVTDEVAGIYRARTPQTAPTAQHLQRAADFPGAVGLGAIVSDEGAPPTAWERIKDFFTPKTVYAQLSCCASSRDCYLCGCNSCLVGCCITSYCTGGHRLNECCFNMGCVSGGFECIWYCASCANGDCMCCASLFSTCCCAPGCIGQCLPCGG
jgi:hypothetical protein